jgi:hypothetical protein
MNQKEKALINTLLDLLNQDKQKEIYSITDDYLKSQPPSVDLLLRLARLFDLPPMVDYIKSIELAEKIFELDTHNPYAMILLAFIYYFDSGPGEIPTYIYEKLDSVQNGDPEIQSMIEYVKSWYWNKKDQKKYLETLKKSTSLFDKHVNNFDDLSDYYIDHNEIAKGITLRKIAISNIKKIYDSHLETEDIFEKFLNERIKGTSMPTRRYEILTNSLNS